MASPHTALASQGAAEHALSKNWFQRVLTWALVITALYVGREILIPMATAGLMVCMLAPAVDKVVRQGIPRSGAVGLVCLVSFLLLASVAWLLFDQAARLGREMPKYEHNLQEKVQKLKQPSSPSSLTRLADMIANIGREITAPVSNEAQKPAPPGETKPVPVEVKQTQRSPFTLAFEMATPLLSPLGMVGLVMLLVVAILLNLEDLIERTTKFLSPRNPQAAASVIGEASARVMRYLWMQVVVNVSYGIPVGLGLMWIGVPNALMWGILATLLRFIPFLGPWLAAAFPISVAILVDPGWDMVLWTVGLFLVMELISNNVVEVILYGTSTGISTVALIISAFFWTSLWGIGGLALATPLTVMLLVVGSHLPALRGLALLLSREPAWTPAERFQNLLGERSERRLLTQLHGYLERYSLLCFLDEVYVPAVLLIERGVAKERSLGRNLRLNRAEAFLNSDVLKQAGRRLAEEASLRAFHFPTGLVVNGPERVERVIGQVTRVALESQGVRVASDNSSASLDSVAEIIERTPVDFVVLVLVGGRLNERVGRQIQRFGRRVPWTRLLVFLAGTSEEESVRAGNLIKGRAVRVLTSLDQLVHEVSRPHPLGEEEIPPRLGAEDGGGETTSLSQTFRRKEAEE